MALAVEISEIAEHFQWLTEEQSQNLPPEKLASSSGFRSSVPLRDTQMTKTALRFQALLVHADDREARFERSNSALDLRGITVSQEKLYEKLFE